MTSAVLTMVSSLSFRASADPSTIFDPPDDSVRKRSSPEAGIRVEHGVMGHYEEESGGSRKARLRVQLAEGANPMAPSPDIY